MAKHFDRDAWLAQKQEKLEGAKAALAAGLQKLQTSEDWLGMLKTLAQLGPLAISRFSFTNIILLESQRPGTTHAGTFKAWLDRGRHVRKGEKGLLVIQPTFRKKGSGAANPGDGDSDQKLIGFRALPVFAVDQTEGEPLKMPSVPDFTGDEAFDDSVEELREVALALPGTPVTNIEVRARRPGEGRALGWYALTTRAIVVITDDRGRAQQFKTLVHEVAHALLHPITEPHTGPEREVEAESTAFVVCHALGLDTGAYSFPYVATWATGEDPLKMVAASGERIAKAARSILDALVEMPAEAPEAAEAA